MPMSIEHTVESTTREQAVFNMKLLQATIKMKKLTLEENIQAKKRTRMHRTVRKQWVSATTPFIRVKRGKDFDDFKSCGVKKLKTAGEDPAMSEAPKVETEEADEEEGEEEEDVFFDAMEIDWTEGEDNDVWFDAMDIDDPHWLALGVRLKEVDEKILKEKAEDAMEVDLMIEGGWDEVVFPSEEVWTMQQSKLKEERQVTAADDTDRTMSKKRARETQEEVEIEKKKQCFDIPGCPELPDYEDGDFDGCAPAPTAEIQGGYDPQEQAEGFLDSLLGRAEESLEKTHNAQGVVEENEIGSEVETDGDTEEDEEDDENDPQQNADSFLESLLGSAQKVVDESGIGSESDDETEEDEADDSVIFE
ncbi:uncharacterized protein BYT42DRAFT_199281 [Radiomyces spectabilis]|uniref:uncharacterized protein n=1 Tax=Radiomyces spectabilis TaxID=64574 RepID=UPI00221F2EDC|nr:uncharacterized protein BYT42DRAFT_199281 [Radiomyces spectabilis]KAI8391548.1 hypothetical protein BYT42DRAFT_199281 [Radiomyces spectabilis]